MPFAGELSLDEEGHPLAADLEFTETEFVVTTVAGPLGRWPLADCRIEADNGRFLLTIGPERAWFVPRDPVVFTQEVLHRWSAASLASAVRAARAAAAPAGTGGAPDNKPPSQPMEESTPFFANWSPRRRAQLALSGVAIVVVLVLASVAVGGSPPSGTIAPMPSSTTTSTFPVVFAGGLSEVAAQWNEAAEELGVNLFLSGVASGRRWQVDLPDDLVLYGTEDPGTGRVHTLMLAAGPGTGQHGELVLAAWGVLISVTNPDLSPEERRALLERLGVDVDRPLTIGLRTETTQGLVRYWLNSGVLGDRVLFGGQPLD
jgi:hypothetical protein